MTKPKMSLDEAMHRWTEATGPNILTAADLLTVATEHWNDGIIADARYSDIVTLVANDMYESVEG